jgi:hypothetical protein
MVEEPKATVYVAMRIAGSGRVAEGSSEIKGKLVEVDAQRVAAARKAIA